MDFEIFFFVIGKNNITEKLFVRVLLPLRDQQIGLSLF